MELLLKLVIIWVCVDVIIIASGWYLGSTVRQNFANWWRNVILDDMEEFELTQLDNPELAMTRLEVKS